MISYDTILANSPNATVLETRKPSENWSDVSKVAFDGSTYSTGDTVHVRNVGYGNIKGFRPATMIVLIFQGDGRYCGTEAPYLYDKVCYMCSPQSGSSEQKPNPNRAFRKKKRRF